MIDLLFGLLLLLCVSIGLPILLMTFEDKLIYFPTKYPEGFWEVSSLPAAKGEVVPSIEDVYFSADDGVRLHGWFCSPQRTMGESKVPIRSETVLLWFHGNAGNITDRYEMIRMLIKIPVRIFIIDYRGYGKSDGTPTELGLYRDARAAWVQLTETRGMASERIVIFGKSLGGAVAVNLASNVSAGGLIVQSSFTSAADMASSVLPLFPTPLLRTRMESIKLIARIECRKLFIHSRSDEVVPYGLGRRLFESATEPKQFYEVEGARHNETYLIGGREYFETLRRFVIACSTRLPSANENAPTQTQDR